MMRTSWSVVVFHEDTIKPSSSTPSHLRNLKLSLFDQFPPLFYSPMIFFYASPCGSDVSVTLKKSLSQILTRFYHFAGRLNVNDKEVVVNCNDEGVPYLEAHANVSMSEVLQKPKQEELLRFIPTGGGCRFTNDLPPLLIQVTFFECGGLAICYCLSHKVADGATLHTFVSAWSRAASSSGHPVVPDLKAAASRFPAQFPFPLHEQHQKKEPTKLQIFPSRRYVFHGSKIRALKASAASTAVPNPTRTEAISALLWRCSIKVARRRLDGGSSKKSSSFLIWPVNIRSRLEPPIGEFSLGNIIFPSLFAVELSKTKVVMDRDSYELPFLVSRLRQQLQQLISNTLSELDGATTINTYMNLIKKLLETTEDADWYTHSSICGMNFYEASNFGWGRPAWMTYLPTVFPNSTVFMDTGRSGGIEAWVTLAEDEMDLLEQDPEFLQFASVNPCPLFDDDDDQQENKTNHRLRVKCAL